MQEEEREVAVELRERQKTADVEARANKIAEYKKTHTKDSDMSRLSRVRAVRARRRVSPNFIRGLGSCEQNIVCCNIYAAETLLVTLHVPGQPGQCHVCRGLVT